MKTYRNLLKRTKQVIVGQIILSGVLPVIGGRKQGYSNSRRMTINRLVQQLCSEEDVGFVDLWSSFVAKEEMCIRGMACTSVGLSRKGADVFVDGFIGTGDKQWIWQRTLFKLVGQGGLAKQAQSGQEDSSSNIMQGNTGFKLRRF